MTAKADISIDIEDLYELKEKLSSDMIARIGVLGSSNRSNDPSGGDNPGITNSEIALKQEFGSVTDNIPPRSFLRMPLETKGREITKFATSSKVKKLLIEGDLKGALALMGVKGEAIIQQAFASGGFGKWAPNAPLTVKLKGGDSPLIHTSQLRRAIMSQVGKNG